MPNTQFSQITIDDKSTIVARGPYHTDIVNVPDWKLVGTPVVVFMVVKNQPNSDGTPNPSGFPNLVADGVGYLDRDSNGQPLETWSGEIKAEPGSANLQMGPGDVVRAVGAAIQVKTNLTEPQNPPVVEVITWCVPQALSAPAASTSDPMTA
jgi:hypothetical protein